MPSKKNPHDQGQKVSHALQVKAQKLDEDAQRRGRARDKAGQYLSKVTEEEWEWCIEEVRRGNTDANICRHLGIHSASLASKRRNDPVFAKAYSEALEDAFVTIAQETRSVARGDEGFSSGDVQRDRLIVETDLKLAAKFARKILGDKIDVDVRSVNIVINKDDEDLI